MYRVKIGNTELNNTLISRGSYSCAINSRECEKYTDATGIEHIIPFGKRQAVISFTIREHTSAEHGDIASIFANRHNVSVRYFNDDTGAYSDGIFHIDNISWTHKNIVGNNINYGATKITLKEY